ncbi:uncharacterized protein LOC111486332 isoform X1 [Cucurbita maxima]|uniref:Uncharacterized protein LOC111486332 isoform X1 n=1 Tax=Cucurbita maxima TaxID=3661 RepID=A0A6J1JPI0_CUCMA|nr:uncharacterized protein LOC111486332 isoform X1 [Cucurbita maxima]
MAFPPTAFSIREYALKMRGKDLTRRSWPFSEKVKEEVAEALLPPISVAKFRWWSQELQILKSNKVVEDSKVDKICPVCGVFVTATVNAMSAHIDGCLAPTTKEKRKNKAGGGGAAAFLKAKSRPPKKRSIAEIFAVAPPVETMTMIHDCEGEKVSGKQRNGDKIKATSLATTLVSAMKTMKANNNNNNKNKEFGHEQLCKKGHRNHKGVLVCCKKPCFKRLSRQKMQKPVKKSNVVAKQQRAVPPIRSILKHSVTNSSSTNFKCSDQVINNGSRKSDRRVSFSDKKDVLGPSTTCVQTGGSPFQDSEGNTNSGESNTGVDSMEVGINNDRSHPCWDGVNHSAEKSISVNRVIPHENSLHLFDHPQKLPSVHSAIPSLLAAQEERQYGHDAHSFCGKSVDYLITPMNGVAALSENAAGRFLNLAESSAKDTRSSLPNWEQSMVAYKEKGVNDGFFCLPLNSKGELIQLNSGLINGFDQMNDTSNTMVCSSRIPGCGLVLPRSARDCFIDNQKLLVDTELTGNQLSLFPLHSNMQENQRYLSAGFDVTETGISRTADIRLQNSERGTECGRFFHSNLMDPPFNPENSSSLLPNPARQTMRLMGKDVAVGGNGKKVVEPEVINFWKNTSLFENCLTNSIQENPMRKRNYLEDTLFYPAGFHSNQVAQRSLLPNAPQGRYPHPRVDRKNSIMYHRSDSVINLNERFNNIHSFSPLPTDQAFNMALNFEAPFFSGSQAVRLSAQPSTFSTSFELGFNQNNLHPAELGNINFPFLQPADESHVQHPRFHSSKSLPPWMLHGHKREDVPTASSKLADINGYYYPFIASGADVRISPSAHQLNEAGYPRSTTPSHLQMKNIPVSTSFHQPISISPRVHSPSIRTSYEDRLKFKSLEMNNAGVLPRWTQRKLIDDVQSNPRTAAKIIANWDKAVNSAGNMSNMSQTDGIVNEAPKGECMARRGPIKLTAGAKHILKPSQRMDLEYNKPTYSTVPSAGLAQCVSLVESQKKSTKVYSF